jgi:hypothetical protein
VSQAFAKSGSWRKEHSDLPIRPALTARHMRSNAYIRFAGPVPATRLTGPNSAPFMRLILGGKDRVRLAFLNQHGLPPDPQVHQSVISVQALWARCV